MHAVTAILSPRSVGRTLVLLTVGLIVANCSSDTSRFNENPLAPGSVPPGQVGTTVGQADPRAFGTPQVSSQPLPPPVDRGPGAYGSNPGTYGSTPGTYGSNPGTYGSTPGTYGSNPGTYGSNPGTYGSNPGAYPSTAPITPETTGAVPRLQQQANRGQAWNWEGGTPITIAPGDSLASLSRRYGVPAQAIAQANGMSGPAALRPGQHLVIPRYNQIAAAPGPRVAAAPQAAPAPTRARLSSVHVVAPGETLLGIANRYHVSIKKLAAANKIAPYTRVKMGDRLVIPGKRSVRVADATPTERSTHSQVATPKPTPVRARTPVRTPARVTRSSTPVKHVPAPVTRTAEVAPVKHVEPVKKTRVASIEPTASIHVATPAEPEDDQPNKVGAPAFRWPVRGRVITSFGTKVNGQRNDGIDLAVPEGTSVRAADDGVVAYAGNELKGYGNLILVRHSDGYVTAYAHASKIMVKRNEKVRRGQIIAKSGQTGNVAAPQLHFEIRKGSSPIDPIQHLPGA